MSNMKKSYIALSGFNLELPSQNLSFFREEFPGQDLDFPGHWQDYFFFDKAGSIPANAICDDIDTFANAQRATSAYDSLGNFCFHPFEDHVEVFHNEILFNFKILDFNWQLIDGMFGLLEKHNLLLVDSETGLLIGRDRGLFLITLVNSAKFRNYYDRSERFSNMVTEIWSWRYNTS